MSVPDDDVHTSRSRGRLAVAASKPALFQSECRRQGVAGLADLWLLCEAYGVRDPRDLEVAS